MNIDQLYDYLISKETQENINDMLLDARERGMSKKVRDFILKENENGN